MKNILSPRFFEGPNHFGMPRGNKILALNEPNRLLFLQIRRLPPSMHKWKEIIDCIKKQAMGMIADQLLMTNPIELVVNSLVPRR